MGTLVRELLSLLSDKQFTFGVKMYIILGPIRKEPLGKEPILPLWAASHVRTQLIIVPGVNSCDGRSLEVLASIALNELLPLHHVLLHELYANHFDRNSDVYRSDKLSQSTR